MLGPINTRLLGTFARRQLFGRDRTVRECSTRSWVLQPQETRVERAAIFCAENLGRITAVMSDTTIDQELKRIRGGRTDHGATTMHLLKDVDLACGRLYCDGMALKFADRPRKLLLKGEARHFRRAALACTYYGSVYFGHWMRDDLSLHLAAESIDVPVVSKRPTYHHEPGYCALLEIQQTALDWARFDELIFIEDVGQNSYKRARYRTIRSRLAKLPQSPYEKIYIRRGTHAARSPREITNGEELDQFLIRTGFHIIEPDKLSSGEIARATAGAKLVLGVEGSHLSHALYSVAEEATICVIQPPHRFNNVYKDYADCLDLHYAFVVGKAVEGGFRVELTDLERLLHQIPP